MILTEKEYNKQAAHVLAVFEMGEIKTRDGQSIRNLDVAPYWFHKAYPITASIGNDVHEFDLNGVYCIGNSQGIDLVIPPFQPAAEPNGSIHDADKIAEFWAKLPNQCEGLANNKPPVDTSYLSDVIQKWRDRFPDDTITVDKRNKRILLYSDTRECYVIKNRNQKSAIAEFDALMNKLSFQ